MEKIHIQELINVKHLKLALETYSKLRGIQTQDIVDCLTKSLNDFLSEKEEGQSVTYDKESFFLMKDGKISKDQTLTIYNKNEVVYTINKQFLNYLSEIRLKHYQEHYDPEKLGLIEIRVTRVYPNFILCDYNGDIEVWLDQYHLVRKDRIKEGDFIKVIPESIIFNGNEIRMKATRRGLDFVSQLIANEVPEVNEGMVSIRHIQRTENVKTYVVVESQHSFLNPIKSLIGVGGSRVVEIKRNLPERLEILKWEDEPEKFITQLFRNNILECERTGEHEFRVRLIDLKSNHYPQLELNLLGTLFPETKVTYELVDEEERDEEEQQDTGTEESLVG